MKTTQSCEACGKHGVMRIPSGRVIRPVFNKHGEYIMCEEEK